MIDLTKYREVIENSGYVLVERRENRYLIKEGGLKARIKNFVGLPLEVIGTIYRGKILNFTGPNPLSKKANNLLSKLRDL